MNSRNDLKILIIEDDLKSANLLKKMLFDVCDWTYEPVTSKSLQDANECLELYSFDIIFLGLNFIDSSGLIAIEELCHKKLKSIIIVVTSEADESRLNQALQSGVHDYLVKGQYNKFYLKKSILYSLSLQKKEEQLTKRIVEAEKKNEKHKESENLFRLLYEALSIGVFIVNSEGVCKQINTAYENVLDASTQECKEKKWFDWIHPDYKKDIFEKWSELLGHGKLFNTESIVVTTKGDERNVSIGFFVFTHSGGVLYVGTIEDITHRKESSNAHECLGSELQQAQKLESIGTLAAGIAHEINTPLQFVINTTTFLTKATDRLLKLIASYRSLLSSCDPGEGTSAAIDQARILEKKAKLSFLEKEIPLSLTQAREVTDRAAKIVRAMKDFSHMGDDKMAREDINKAIESTVTISKNEWKYVSKLETKLDPNLPVVECLIGDIKQVLLNLVVNAAHAIGDVAKDGQLGTITVTSYYQNDSVFITVEDTGSGIAEDIRDKVFDPFFTTKKVGKGTGQGLSMSYQTIVEKHKGQLSFDTQVGKGTKFTVRLSIEQKRED